MLELLKWPEGKPPFIIRDDDVSFFTNSKMLQELYELAWSKGFVVTFSIVPNILGSIPPFPNVKELLSHFKYEPCIPPFARGNAKRYKIQDNSELVSFLLEGKKKRICDMTLHGLSHERTEFLSPKKELIEKRLKDAIKIFADAFNFQPKVFIFPYDKCSSSALQVMKKNAISVCKTASLFNRVLDKAGLGKLPSFKVSNNIVEFYHNVSAFSPIIGFHKNVAPFEDAKREFRLRYAHNDLFCLVHHYWEFFFDWEEHITQKDILTALNTFLNYVDSFNVWKCSFNEVSDWLLAFNSIHVRRINEDKMIIKTMLPIRNLTFQSTGVCEVRGLKNGLINNREGIWTIENVPPNCLVEVAST